MFQFIICNMVVLKSPNKGQDPIVPDAVQTYSDRLSLPQRVYNPWWYKLLHATWLTHAAEGSSHAAIRTFISIPHLTPPRGKWHNHHTHWRHMYYLCCSRTRSTSLGPGPRVLSSVQTQNKTWWHLPPDNRTALIQARIEEER